MGKLVDQGVGRAWVVTGEGVPAAPLTLAISLRNERGWTLSLLGNVPVSWLDELMRPYGKAVA